MTRDTIMAKTQKGFFATRLKELRRERGLTQAGLAKAAGLSLDGIRQLEYGRREPGYDTLQRLAKALGISPGMLFPDEPAPPPRKKAK
jgi:transcriptional regulator with XRE-family HTH domain